MSGITNAPLKPDTKRLDIFGPHGLRELLRTILKITQSNLAGKYAVHELLSADDTPYPCVQAEMHPNETAGRNLRPTNDRFWMAIESDGGWIVNAGPIKHRGKIITSLSAASEMFPGLYHQSRLMPHHMDR